MTFELEVFEVLAGTTWHGATGTTLTSTSTDVSVQACHTWIRVYMQSAHSRRPVSAQSVCSRRPVSAQSVHSQCTLGVQLVHTQCTLSARSGTGQGPVSVRSVYGQRVLTIICSRYEMNRPCRAVVGARSNLPPHLPDHLRGLKAALTSSEKNNVGPGSKL